MISGKDALLQAPGTGSLMILTIVLTMGGFPAAGDNVSEPRIVNLEEDVSHTQIQLSSLQSDVKHYRNLMEKQAEQNDKIYNLLLQLCQGMASTTDQKCYP